MKSFSNYCYLYKINIEGKTEFYYELFALESWLKEGLKFKHIYIIDIPLFFVCNTFKKTNSIIIIISRGEFKKALEKELVLSMNSFTSLITLFFKDEIVDKNFKIVSYDYKLCTLE